jgi:hypothetical protein
MCVSSCSFVSLRARCALLARRADRICWAPAQSEEQNRGDARRVRSGVSSHSSVSRLYRCSWPVRQRLRAVPCSLVLVLQISPVACWSVRAHRKKERERESTGWRNAEGARAGESTECPYTTDARSPAPASIATCGRRLAAPQRNVAQQAHPYRRGGKGPMRPPSTCMVLTRSSVSSATFSVNFAPPRPPSFA